MDRVSEREREAEAPPRVSFWHHSPKSQFPVA